MKIVFDQAFYTVYTGDPAAEPGRMEAIVNALPDGMPIVEPEPAAYEQILRAHTEEHVSMIRDRELYDIAALAAGASIQAARIGLSEPAFGLVRPPGHHASADASWGFCFFNNMAVALLALKAEGLVNSAFVLDIDLHYGDGTVNILGGADWVDIVNPAKNSRSAYLDSVERTLASVDADIIGISAGFDNHQQDWGGLLATEDYHRIASMVQQRAAKNGGGCFALLEGGYNHLVLGQNVAALLKGLAGPPQ
ncbi:MAG TPA: histone deacetylase family protein [Desulfosalsimonadaceae bacterium]|nr:histone deacetylase family protein [Desulfosalsimonadaceae bacterium]